MLLLNTLKSYSLFIKGENFKVSRLRSTLYYIWFMSIGVLVATHGLPQPLTYLKAVAAMAGVSLSVYVFNDVMDSDMDKLNPEKKERPIPSGKVTKGEAMSFVLISGLLGLTVSFFINLKTFLFSLAYFVLGVLYSAPPIRLKQRFLLKEPTVGGLLLLSSLIGGSTNGSFSWSALFVGIFLFLYSMAVYPIFEDVTDVEEDKKYGCKTLAMVLSLKERIELAIAIVVVIMMLTPLTYVPLGFNLIAPIVVCFMCLLFLRYLFPLLVPSKSNELQNIEPQKMRAFRYYKIVAIISQIGFIIGAIRL